MEEMLGMAFQTLSNNQFTCLSFRLKQSLAVLLETQFYPFQPLRMLQHRRKHVVLSYVIILFDPTYFLDLVHCYNGTSENELRCLADVTRKKDAKSGVANELWLLIQEDAFFSLPVYALYFLYNVLCFCCVGRLFCELLPGYSPITHRSRNANTLIERAAIWSMNGSTEAACIVKQYGAKTIPLHPIHLLVLWCHIKHHLLD